MQLLALLGTLTLLVCNAAAGLASRLAGGLALAAAAVLGALAHVAGLKGLDSLHNRYLQFSNRFDLCRHAKAAKRSDNHKKV